MLTDERLKQLMQQVGMPESTSLLQALRQCDMEATLAERERCAELCDALPANDPKGANCRLSQAIRCGIPSHLSVLWFNDDMSAGAHECAAAIRAR